MNGILIIRINRNSHRFFWLYVKMTKEISGQVRSHPGFMF